MKKAITLLVLVLVIAMAGCQSKQPIADSEMQSQIDELRTQLENNQKELENANSRIKELQDEVEKKDEQLDNAAAQQPNSNESSAEEQNSSSNTTGSKENSDKSNMPEPNIKDTAVIISISNNGQKNIAQSSSFKASANQVLKLEIKSSITGGSVDFFLFSPSNQEQRIIIGGNDETKTINLTEGTWAYNCTGLFDSGNITITGTIE